MKETPRHRTVPQWQRRASDRGLGSRPRVRIAAVILWASFLGAIPMLLTWFTLVPGHTNAALELDQISLVFFLGVVLSLIPTSIAMILTRRPEPRLARREPEYEHEQHR